MSEAKPPGSPPVEVELKLALAPADMERLLASAQLRQQACGALTSQDLRATYYDTVDHRLRRRGAGLRVRESGGRRVQTLKTARGGVGGLARGEWEVAVAGERPDPTAFDDPAALDVTGLLLAEELAPVFRTEVHRRTLPILWPERGPEAAQIELAFDTGRIVAGAAESPVAELELELLHGEPAALFGLAEALRAMVPMRIEPLDKSARGWLLATGEPPPIRKAGTPVLDGGQTVDEAVAAILDASLGQWLANEAAATDGRQSEGVHQMRVGLRRLRSTFSLFKSALGEAAREQWKEDLRWLQQALGRVRDLDVLLADALAETEAAHVDDGSLKALCAAAEAARDEAQAELRAVLHGERYADLTLRLAAWIARHGWRDDAGADMLLRQRQPLASFAAEILHHHHRRALKRGRGFRRLEPAQRHKLRIALKKLRYGLEFFEGVFPGKRLQRMRKAAAGLQDELGHLNDLEVARALVREVATRVSASSDATEVALGGGVLLGRQTTRAEGLVDEARDAWRAFRSLKPAWKRRA